MQINLWVLVDHFGKIYYTGDNREAVENYKESIYFNDKDKQIVQLTGKINLKGEN